MAATEYLYSTHDIPVLITLGQCLLLSALLLLTCRRGSLGNIYLALLVLSFGVHAFDTLIYWNENINPWVAQAGLWPFLILKWVPICQGPLVYAYVSERINKENIKPLRTLMHSVIPLCACLLLVIIGLSAQENTWVAGSENWGAWSDRWEYALLMWGHKISALSYGVITLVFLKNNIKTLEARYSNPVFAHPLWLLMIVLGFMGVWLWLAVMGVFGVLAINGYVHSQVVEGMGVAANYFQFVYVTSIVFFSLMKSHLDISQIHTLSLEPSVTPAPNNLVKEKSPDEDAARRVKEIMIAKDLHLFPNLTLNQLGEACGYDERKVSSLINDHLGMTFFELVNVERVEQAKRLLAETESPVSQVCENSGFNSKSTFHRIFKRYSKITASEYRRQCRG